MGVWGCHLDLNQFLFFFRSVLIFWIVMLVQSYAEVQLTNQTMLRQSKGQNTCEMQSAFDNDYRLALWGPDQNSTRFGFSVGDLVCSKPSGLIKAKTTCKKEQTTTGQKDSRKRNPKKINSFGWRKALIREPFSDEAGSLSFGPQVFEWALCVKMRTINHDSLHFRTANRTRPTMLHTHAPPPSRHWRISGWRPDG